MSNLLSISDSLPRFEGEYASAKRELLGDIGLELGITILFGALLVGVATKAFGEPLNWKTIIVAVLCAFTAAWLTAVIFRLRNLPVEVIHKGYHDVRTRSPELVGLIKARLWRAIEENYTYIPTLASTGEAWEPDARFAVATSLVTGFRRIETYYATSTDSPYGTLDVAREFYVASRGVMKNAEVRRLLVFPLETILHDLRHCRAQRDSLLAFIELHHRGIGEGQSPKGYKLRYWPRSISELRHHMRRHFQITDAETDETSPVLVDMAVVEGRLQSDLGRRHLLFGQVALKGDQDKLKGNGMVKCGPFTPAKYRQWFDHVWKENCADCEPAAQLVFWAKLFGLREEIQRDKFDGGVGSMGEGQTFLQAVEGVLKSSKSLCAVDIASHPRMWCDVPGYKIFHESMTLSAEDKNNRAFRHTRVFVIREPIGSFEAKRFVNLIIAGLVDKGVEVFIHRKRDLVEHDFAVGDYIIVDDCCFYLAPEERLTDPGLCEARNLVQAGRDPKLLDLFKEQFNSLIDKSKSPPWKHIVSPSFDREDLIRALTTEI
ncbi:MAG: hypothetical protein ACLQVM_22035 [Terriglobia bacterium]